MAKRRLEPGDRVAVSTKTSKGEGRYVGVDDRSGMPIVAFEKLTVDDGGKRVQLDGHEAYVCGKDIRRD